LGLALSTYAYIKVSTLIAGLLVLAFLLIGLTAVFARTFALKAQDRAARAEEKLRHFILSGKALPAELKLAQILALRFASDEEYLYLVNRAVIENLPADEIKKAIKNWRADDHRI